MQPTQTLPANCTDIIAGDDEWLLIKENNIWVSFKHWLQEGQSSLLCKARVFNTVDPQKTSSELVQLLPTKLREMIATKKGDVSIENGYAWLELHQNEQQRSSTPVLEDVRAFSEALNKGEVVTQPPHCDTCGESWEGEFTLRDTKVWALCKQCLEKDHKDFVRQTRFDVVNLPVLIGVGALLSLGCSILWALVWLSYDLSLEYLGIYRLPIVLLVLSYIGIGFVAGKPISLVFRRFPGRGARAGALLALAFCIVGIVIGEFLITAFLIMINLKVMPSLFILPMVWVDLLKEIGIIYLIGKITAAAVACHLTYKESIPGRPRLRPITV